MRKYLIPIIIGLMLAGTTLAATKLAPVIIAPGTNGQVLTTVGATTTWANSNSGSATTTIFSNTTSTGPIFVFTTSTNLSDWLITSNGSTGVNFNLPASIYSLNSIPHTTGTVPVADGNGNYVFRAPCPDNYTIIGSSTAPRGSQCVIELQYLNGLSTTSQLFATSGPLLSIVSSGNTHTFTTLSTSSMGLQPLIIFPLGFASTTHLGALSPLSISGQNVIFSGTIPVSSTSLSVVTPLILTGNSLSIPTSTSGVNGYLSASDWSLFNSKGTISTSSPVTVGYIPLWGTASKLTGTSTIFETGGNVGIGNTSPTTGFDVGSTSTGRDAAINATWGAEQMPPLTTGNWTLGAGWGFLTSPDRIDKSTSSLGTAVPSGASPIVASTTYKVVITVDSFTPGEYGAKLRWTLGGIRGPAIVSSGTFTNYITTASTGNLTFTPSTSSILTTISAVSAVPLTLGTGDLSVYGNTRFFSPIMGSVRIHGISGTAASGTADMTMEPVRLVLEDTSDTNTWNTTTPYAALDFAGGDTTASGSGTKARIGALSEDSQGRRTSLVFYPSSGGTESGLTEGMRLTSGGNLGLGGNPGSFKFYMTTGGNTQAVYETSGTTINGSQVGFLMRKQGSGSDGAEVTYRVFDHNLFFKQYYFSTTTGSGDIYFQTSPTSSAMFSTAMTIQQSGNIGIGTTTPQEALDVNGYALFNQSYGSLAEYTSATSTGSTIIIPAKGNYIGWSGASSTISTQAGTNYVTYGITGGATSTLTIGTNGNGIYKVSFTASLQNSTVNDIIHCDAFQNGTELKGVASETKVLNTSDEKSMSGGPAYVRATSSDVFDLRCTNHSGASTITVNHLNFGIDRISR